MLLYEWERFFHDHFAEQKGVISCRPARHIALMKLKKVTYILEDLTNLPKTAQKYGHSRQSSSWITEILENPVKQASQAPYEQGSN